MKTPRNTKPSSEAEVIPPASLIRAAVNAPVNEFTLGNRTFAIKDLPYDSYIAFISYLTPLIEAVVQKVAGTQGVSIPGIDLKASAFSATRILGLCSKELPEMVRIICACTDPEITVEEIKELAGRPTVLVTVVLKQITQNGMIKDFADFFAQVLSVVKPLTQDPNPSTEAI